MTPILEKSSKNPTVVMGDFNFNHLDYTESPAIQKYMDMFMCTGFAPLMSKPPISKAIQIPVLIKFGQT